MRSTRTQRTSGRVKAFAQRASNKGRANGASALLIPVAVIDTLVNYALSYARNYAPSRITDSRRIAKFVAISREYAMRIYDSARERATSKIPDSVKISRESHS